MRGNGKKRYGNSFDIQENDPNMKIMGFRIVLEFLEPEFGTLSGEKGVNHNFFLFSL